MEFPQSEIRQTFAQKHRIALIIISLFFIAGGAFNDGFSAGFWALPFILFIYKFTQFPRFQRLLICTLIFIVMATISHYKWESPIVFPVIGQKVTIIEDIPTISYPNDVHFDKFDGKHASGHKVSNIKQGSVFFVRKIIPNHADFGNQHRFLLSNETDEFIVSDYSLTEDLSKRTNEIAFCEKVEWEFCDDLDKNFLGENNTDPMRVQFRWLASLMYYPNPNIIIWPIVYIAHLIF